MRVQLLLLGAIAALTLGAVSLAGSVPAASISAIPQPSTTPTAEASQAPEVAQVATPGTADVTVTTDTATTTATATAEAVVEPTAAPATSSIPAACATAIQVVRAAHGRLGPPTSAIASAIAECFGQLPDGIDFQIRQAHSGDHAGGDSGD